MLLHGMPVVCMVDSAAVVRQLNQPRQLMSQLNQLQLICSWINQTSWCPSWINCSWSVVESTIHSTTVESTKKHMSAHVDSTTVESTRPVDNPVDSTVVDSRLIQPSNQPQLNQPKSICQPMLIQLAFSTRKWLIQLHFNGPNISDVALALLDWRPFSCNPCNFPSRRISKCKVNHTQIIPITRSSNFNWTRIVLVFGRANKRM